MTDRGSLWAQRAFMQLWFARLAGVAAGQMLMVAVGWMVLGGVGTLLVAGLWLRLFPALAQRDALLGAGTAKP